MGTLTIRNLDEHAKQRLRERSARRGISVEQAVREILLEGTAPRRRKKSIFEDLTRLGVKPEEPFDQKKMTDDMWDEGLL